MKTRRYARSCTRIATTRRLPSDRDPTGSASTTRSWSSGRCSDRPTSRARSCASRTHVDNAAHAVVVAATDDRARGRVYNVGEPEALTWTQWARLVAAQLRWNGELVVAPSDQMPTRLRDS